MPEFRRLTNIPGPRWTDGNGKPCGGWWLRWKDSETSNLAAVWADAFGMIPQQNPTHLNMDGSLPNGGDVFGETGRFYDLDVLNPDGAVMWSARNIAPGIGSGQILMDARTVYGNDLDTPSFGKCLPLVNEPENNPNSVPSSAALYNIQSILLELLNVEAVTGMDIARDGSGMRISLTFANLKTGHAQNANLPLPNADTDSFGIMSPDHVRQIAESKDDIQELFHLLGLITPGSRKAVSASLPQPPSQQDLADAFNDYYVQPPIPGDSVLDTQASTLWVLDSEGDWVPLGTESFGLFDHENPGLIRQPLTPLDGDVVAKPGIPGVGQVQGFASLAQKINPFSLLRGGKPSQNPQSDFNDPWFNKNYFLGGISIGQGQMTGNTPLGNPYTGQPQDYWFINMPYNEIHPDTYGFQIVYELTGNRRVWQRWQHGYDWQPWIVIGMSVSTGREGNTIAQRDSNGYLFARFFNQNSETDSGSMDRVFFERGNDGYLRKMDASLFARRMSLKRFDWENNSESFYANLNDDFFKTRTFMAWGNMSGGGPYTGWGTLINTRHREGTWDGLNYGDQMVIGTIAAGSQFAGRVWTRSQSGTWSAWTELQRAYSPVAYIDANNRTVPGRPKAVQFRIIGNDWNIYLDSRNYSEGEILTVIAYISGTTACTNTRFYSISPSGASGQMHRIPSICQNAQICHFCRTTNGFEVLYLQSGWLG